MLPSAPHPASSGEPRLISDGAGGAIITWQDYRSSSDYDIYAERINASGVAQWTANGVAIRIKNRTVKQAGRATKGVHLIKPQEGDYVASVARISAEEMKRAGAQMSEETSLNPSRS